jgi:hypothetical protein
MDMIGPQRIGADGELIAMRTLRKEREIPQSILIVAKYIKTANCPLRDVVRHSRHNDTSDSGHGRDPKVGQRKSNL